MLLLLLLSQKGGMSLSHGDDAQLARLDPHGGGAFSRHPREMAPANWGTRQATVIDGQSIALGTLDAYMNRRRARCWKTAYLAERGAVSSICCVIWLLSARERS